jgi:lipoate-protein ligase A
MALDEALLLEAAESGLAGLRFYEWDQPTLSLGYFQRYADRAVHVPSLRCALVRRTTGGGAILHDHELTYSCTLPSGHPLARRAEGLYYAIHESIADVLAGFGIAAHLQSCDERALDFPSQAPTGGCGCAATAPATAGKASRSANEPFLCFERRTAGDIIFNGQKVVGSAQRRCRGAVLQHGSILLARSSNAPELPGVSELAGRRVDARELAAKLRAVLSDRLRFDFEDKVPVSETLQRAAAIEASKFSTDLWRHLR